MIRRRLDLRRRKRQKETNPIPTKAGLRDYDELEGSLLLPLSHGSVVASPSRDNFDNDVSFKKKTDDDIMVSATPSYRFTYDDDNDNDAEPDLEEGWTATTSSTTERLSLLSAVDGSTNNEARFLQALARANHRGWIKAEQDRVLVARGLRDVPSIGYHVLRQLETANDHARQQQARFDSAMRRGQTPNDDISLPMAGALLIANFVDLVNKNNDKHRRRNGEQRSLLSGEARPTMTSFDDTLLLATRAGLAKADREIQDVNRSIREIHALQFHLSRQIETANQQAKHHN